MDVKGQLHTQSLYSFPPRYSLGGPRPVGVKRTIPAAGKNRTPAVQSIFTLLSYPDSTLQKSVSTQN